MLFSTDEKQEKQEKIITPLRRPSIILIQQTQPNNKPSFTRTLKLTKSLSRKSRNDIDSKKRMNILSKFIINSIEKVNQTDLFRKYDFSSWLDLLISEIKKESFLKETDEKQRKDSRKLGKILNPNKNKILILNLLQKLVGFKAFLKFNQVNESILSEMINVIQYKKYKSGECVYKEGEKSEFFYCVIKGKAKVNVMKVRFNSTGYVSTLLSKPLIRKEYLDNKNNKELYTIYKETMLNLTSGSCFGETSLFSNREREESVYASSDLEVMLVNKRFFFTDMSRVISLCEMNRKGFLKEVFPFLNGQNQENLEKILSFLYKNMSFQYFKKNEILYEENSTASSLYIVYQGECGVGLNNHSQIHSQIMTQNESSSKVISKFTTKLMTLSYGSILGYEVVRRYLLKNEQNSNQTRIESVKFLSTYQNKRQTLHFLSKKINYDYTAFSQSDETVVFVFDLERIQNEDLKIEFFNFLLKKEREHTCQLRVLNENKEKLRKKFEDMKKKGKEFELREGKEALILKNKPRMFRIYSRNSIRNENKNLFVSSISKENKENLTHITHNFTEVNEGNSVFNKNSYINQSNDRISLQNQSFSSNFYENNKKETEKIKNFPITFKKKYVFNKNKLSKRVLKTVNLYNTEGNSNYCSGLFSLPLITLRKEKES